MAEERKCFAGDLGTDQLGKVVKVVTKSGAVVEDRVATVLHRVQEFAGESFEPRTWVQFENVVPANAFQQGPYGSGFEVAPEQEVTVQP